MIHPFRYYFTVQTLRFLFYFLLHLSLSSQNSSPCVILLFIFYIHYISSYMPLFRILFFTTLIFISIFDLQFFLTFYGSNYILLISTDMFRMNIFAHTNNHAFLLACKFGAVGTIFAKRINSFVKNL